MGFFNFSILRRLLHENVHFSRPPFYIDVQIQWNPYIRDCELHMRKFHQQQKNCRLSESRLMEDRCIKGANFEGTLPRELNLKSPEVA